MSKISIRFYDDKEVRAVWDDQNSRWLFSVLDRVGVLRGEENYTKNRNYWKYLKAKLKKENSQLVSRANQLKLTAADGKNYFTDLFGYDQIDGRGVFTKAVDYFFSANNKGINFMPGGIGA
jgi:cell filamentation protein